MKLLIIIMTTCFMQVSAATFAQKLTFNQKATSLEKLFKIIRVQTGYFVIYSDEQIDDSRTIDVNFKNADLKTVLDKVISNQSLEYAIVDRNIILKAKQPSLLNQLAAVFANIDVRGQVTGTTNQPLPGASVTIKGTKRFSRTNDKGEFFFSNVEENAILLVSFVGYKTREVAVGKPGVTMLIKLAEAEQALKDVVVTGMFERPVETYTGAASSFSAKDLAKVSNTNLIAALRTLDPSFQLNENISSGANPNVLPNVTVRGGNSLPDISTTPPANLFNYNNSLNVPLFILDGFEVNLQRVVDLPIARIARVDILKDAPATAIYGSRAANGVVVIETIQPKAGALEVSYNTSFTFETPDLSDYDLLNSREKLDLELRSGVYTSTDNIRQQDLLYYYNSRLAEIERGVNTDWMALPLRNAYNQSHNLSIQSGSNGIVYGVGVSYNTATGVMKGSDRKNGRANTFLSYRVNKFQFKNDFSIGLNNSNNSPYGAFSQYVKMNPYLTPYDADGNLKKELERLPSNLFTVLGNPLFNPTLNIVDKSKYISFTNNFFAQYQAAEWLKLSTRFAVTKQSDESDRFLPAQHTSFLNTPTFEKGSYNKSYGQMGSFSGVLSADISKSFGKNMFFVTLNSTANENKFETSSFLVQGFPNSRLDQLSSGKAYPAGSKPSGTESISRTFGVLANMSYAYDLKYLLDFSYKIDGSSQFGTNQRFASFWSAGLGWNLHKEAFIKKIDAINKLKLTGSYGSTGSQNFSSFLGISTSNYYNDVEYNGVVGTYLMGYGNPDLKWQVTNKTNIGLELTLFNRLDLRTDYFREKTIGSLATISTPLSVGFNSYSENMGNITGKGWEVKGTYRIISKPTSRDSWSVSLRTFSVDKKIDKVSENIKRLNRQNQNIIGNAPVTIYAEGQSTTAIWAVKSLGVDPSTGRELFLKADGTYSNIPDPSLKIIAGDTQADVEGNISSNFEFSGIGMNVFFRFRYGGQAYNQTLIDRVENIDIINNNVDRRVLEQRWMKPGDQTFFTGISTVKTGSSSRFVQNDNLINLESLSVYYRLPEKLNKRLHLKNTTLSFYTANIFTISSIKRERGLDYPFSQTYSLQLSTSF